MKSELLETLQIIETIANEPLSVAMLCVRFKCSIATLKRRLSDARNLGANIQATKHGTEWKYYLLNKTAVIARLKRWIDLEIQRSLV